MSLNPNRPRVSADSPLAEGPVTAFRAEAETALEGFRLEKSDLERLVRRGDLTPKVARERAAAAARNLNDRLTTRAAEYRPAPAAYLDLLVRSDESRRLAREAQSPSMLQRETNRLIRDLLVEQQVINRQAEFEGRAFRRPLTGGVAAASLEGLLAFHRAAEHSGDGAALEWVRRQLEAYRPRAASDEERDRIDLATDRPGQVNPRIVERYLDALRGRPVEVRAAFAEAAKESGDANACVAAYRLAREAPEGFNAPWVRELLNGLASFPDAAIAILRSSEAEANAAETRAAEAVAAEAAAFAEIEAKLPTLTSPSEQERGRQDRFAGLAEAEPDQPIGLAPALRGRIGSDTDPRAGDQTASNSSAPATEAA